MSMIARLVGAIAVWCIVESTDLQRACRDPVWEKLEGVRPELSDARLPLFSAINSNGITRSCFERCRSVDCTAFVVDFERSVCYGLPRRNDSSIDYGGRDESDDNDDKEDGDEDDVAVVVVGNGEYELLAEANSTFYQRICVKVPARCRGERLWQIERTSGAILIDPTAIELPHRVRRSRCYEACVNAGRGCRSAQFRATRPLSARDEVGRCYLSKFERATRPQAYRVSIYRDEYLQKQCREPPDPEYCAYAEFRGATLPYSDAAIPNLDHHECGRRCDLGVDGFFCRGYTIDRSSGQPTCLLHSEDTTSLGVGSLVECADRATCDRDIVYKQREPCLDLKIRCDESAMTIELRTSEGFHGRIYASGHAESCGVQGLGNNLTVLEIPLPKRSELRSSYSRCGLRLASSHDRHNRSRTLLWTTIVVQFNPIVQRLGDQAVKVGCSLYDDDLLHPRNVSVHSSYAFLHPNAGLLPTASIVTNVSIETPRVTMRILNEHLEDALVTQLGQKLILKIEINPSDGPYDIAAGHLVASSASGDASCLLLDEIGCPTDPTAFPGLFKDPSDGRSLISSFAAFKFPENQLVRFNVVVRFCLGRCAPAACGGGRPSYGRRRRRRRRRRWTERGRRSSEPTVNARIDRESSPREAPEELPLQLSIVVQGPVVEPLRTLEKPAVPDTVFLRTGESSVEGLLCVNAGLALGLLIFWLIVQIGLIAGCLVTVARYRRTALRAEEDRADVLARHLYGFRQGNSEMARKVRWADRRVSSQVG